MYDHVWLLLVTDFVCMYVCMYIYIYMLGGIDTSILSSPARLHDDAVLPISGVAPSTKPGWEAAPAPLSEQR